MSELLDDQNPIKERRGSVLNVLAILSFIFIGLNAAALIWNTIQGPLTPDEIKAEKIQMLQTATPEMEALLGEEFIPETIRILEISNDNHYLIQGVNICIYVIGFYAVYLMFNLKRVGYYYYIGYSLLPALVSLYFFGAGFLVWLGLIFQAFFALVFLILYGFQLKRMS